ncbi:MAG TPA: hypothetical protein VHC63_10030 [Acidimicrobiales bacterium]|nr:hypothetical protein [Acidimicrobiales bacterium]
MSERGRARFSISADALVVAIFALLGLRVGLNQLSDNSGFTHLATGIAMTKHGLLPAIPRVDPYTFTAHGKAWVVQSWLAEAGVGWAYRLGGQHAVTLLSGVTMAACGALLAVLARTPRPLRTAAAVAPAVLITVGQWTGRPLLVGLLAFGFTILVVERRWSPWWLVPTAWIWVNSHGSFPLGAAWLGLVVIGAWIDRRPAPLRYAVTFAGALALSAVNPLGPRLLVFPLTAITKREAFSHVIEWRSPDFHTGAGVLALVGIVASLAIIGGRGRLTWRDALPVAAFIGLSLTASRNLAPLGYVVAPVLGRALDVGESDAERAPLSPSFVRLATVFVVLVGLIFALGSLQRPLVDASTYPVAQVRWLERHHRFAAPHRVAEEDTVGNYIELRHGARGDVFVDDRVDLFPLSLVRDELGMVDGTDRGLRAIDRWDIDTVLWRSDSVFVQRLTSTGRWDTAVRRGGFVVLTRRTD